MRKGSLLAVDGLAARAVAVGEVTLNKGEQIYYVTTRLSKNCINFCMSFLLYQLTTLQHEVRNHTVELGALVAQRLAGLAHALLAGAQRAEVLGRLGHDVRPQGHLDPAGGGAADGHVKVDNCGESAGRAGG